MAAFFGTPFSRGSSSDGPQSYGLGFRHQSMMGRRPLGFTGSSLGAPPNMQPTPLQSSPPSNLTEGQSPGVGNVPPPQNLEQNSTFAPNYRNTNGANSDMAQFRNAFGTQPPQTPSNEQPSQLNLGGGLGSFGRSAGLPQRLNGGMQSRQPSYTEQQQFGNQGYFDQINFANDQASQYAADPQNYQAQLYGGGSANTMPAPGVDNGLGSGPAAPSPVRDGTYGWNGSGSYMPPGAAQFQQSGLGAVNNQAWTPPQANTQMNYIPGVGWTS